MRSRQKRGQATIEFALVIPVIAALLWGIGWVVPLVNSDIQLTNAARGGAHAAAETADQIETLLNCSAPVSSQCIQVGVDTIRTMVDAGLPCGGGATLSDCKSATYAFAQDAFAYGVKHCLANGAPCNSAGSLALFPFISGAQNCKNATGTTASCLSQAEYLSEAAIEVGLGCDYLGNSTLDCPKLIPSSNSATAYCLSTPPTAVPRTPASCNPAGQPPDCTKGPNPKCDPSVAEEIIAGVAQRSLVCIAVRRSLGLPTTRTTCDRTDVTDSALSDNPYIDSIGNGSPAMGLSYYPNADNGLIPFENNPCPTAVNVQLFYDICGGPGRDRLLVQIVTIHWQPTNKGDYMTKGDSIVVATATAVPVTQFQSG